MEKLRLHAVDVVSLLALLLACSALFGELRSVLDLAPWDEADYLRQGFALSTAGLPDPEWGPLYVAWYAALSLFSPDPIDAYYLSHTLLGSGSASLIFACARRLRASPGVALLGALLFLLSAAPHVIPRPTLLALLFALGGLLVATWTTSAAARSASVGLGLLLGSFARPELFAGFLLVSAALVVLASKRVPILGAYSLCVGALVAVLGNPFGGETGRRLYAFCQHYALGEVTRSALPMSPWHQCTVILERSFGEVNGVVEALWRNPSAFIVHVLDNAAKYPVASVKLFLRGFEDDVPQPAHLVALLVMTSLAAVALWRGRAELVGALRTPEVRLAGGALLAVLAPTFLSALLIHPRQHYLVLQGVFVPLFVVAVLGATTRAPSANGWKAWSLVVPALLFAPTLQLARKPVLPRPNLEVVTILDGLRPNLTGAQPFGILELQGGYDAYLGDDFERVSPRERRAEETFPEFLHRRGVSVVVFEPLLTEFALVKDAPEFAAFESAPEAYGFRRLPVGSTGRWLAVRDTYAPNARSTRDTLPAYDPPK